MIYFISGDDFVNSEEKRLPKQPLFSFTKNTTKKINIGFV